MDHYTVDTIDVMRRQEAAYTVQDFMCSVQPLDVDADCRTKMVAWCYQIVDFCNFNRETVEYAVNYIDRFCVAAPQLLQDRSLYQLAFMTALYTAIKLNESEAMDPDTVAKLSRGMYTGGEFEAMEGRMLSALRWRMNPPTSMSFVRKIVDLMPLSDNVAAATLDICKYQIELALADCSLCTVQRSVLAYCSLLNAMESLSVDPKLNLQLSHRLEQILRIEKANTQNISSSLYQSVVHDPVIKAMTVEVTNSVEQLSSCTLSSPRSTTVSVSR